LGLNAGAPVLTKLDQLSKLFTQDQSPGKAMSKEALRQYGVRVKDLMTKFDKNNDRTITAAEISELFQNYDRYGNEIEDTAGIDRTIQVLKDLFTTTKCCKAMTAKCSACAKGLTVEEYCTQSPLPQGCPTKVKLECVKEGDSVMGGYTCCPGLEGVTTITKKWKWKYTLCKKKLANGIKEKKKEEIKTCYDYNYDLCYHEGPTSKICASMLDNNKRYGAIYQRVGSVYKSGRDCYRARTACWKCLTPYYRDHRTDALTNLGQCSPCAVKPLSSEQLLAKLVRKLLE